MSRDAKGPRMARSGSAVQGFALVEVLAALAVASVSSLAAAVGFTAALRAAHAAAAAHRALDVVADAGERLRAVGVGARAAALMAWTADARDRLGRLPGVQPAEERRAQVEPSSSSEGPRLVLRWADRVDARERELRVVAGIALP